MTFTFDYLTSSDIPFYDNASASYDRYNAMWWIMTFDIFRWIGPLMASFTVGLILLDPGSQSSITLFYTITFIILIVLEVVKIVIWTWQYVYCQDYQLCRNFNPSGNPDSANYVFYIFWIYSMAYLLIFIVYSAMVSVLKKEAWKIAGLMENETEMKQYVVKVDAQKEQESDEEDGGEEGETSRKIKAKLAKEPMRLGKQSKKSKRSKEV